MKLICSLMFLALFVSACGGDSSNSPTSPSSTSATSNLPFSTVDLRVGTGAEATTGRAVTVNYTGWLYSETAANHHGSKFDSSFDRNQPYVFTLGAGTVIKGWDQGVAGMKVGGQRTLIIPPSLGYGALGNPPIPGNATLVFDIALLNVQ